MTVATLRVIPIKDGAKETRNANARLIAAAPSMLTLLEKVAASACLKQEIGNRCICFACEANRIIDSISL